MTRGSARPSRNRSAASQCVASSRPAITTSPAPPSWILNMCYAKSVLITRPHRASAPGTDGPPRVRRRALGINYTYPPGDAPGPIDAPGGPRAFVERAPAARLLFLLDQILLHALGTRTHVGAAPTGSSMCLLMRS